MSKGALNTTWHYLPVNLNRMRRELLIKETETILYILWPSCSKSDEN